VSAYRNRLSFRYAVRAGIREKARYHDSLRSFMSLYRQHERLHLLGGHRKCL